MSSSLLAVPTPDPGIAALAAQLPCVTRRALGPNNASVFPDYNFFTWDNQYIDTPALVTPRRTSDTVWTVTPVPTGKAPS